MHIRNNLPAINALQTAIYLYTVYVSFFNQIIQMLEWALLCLGLPIMLTAVWLAVSFSFVCVSAQQSHVMSVSGDECAQETKRPPGGNAQHATDKTSCPLQLLAGVFS